MQIIGDYLWLALLFVLGLLFWYGVSAGASGAWGRWFGRSGDKAHDDQGEGRK